MLVLALGALMVFLILAAQYEKWSLPLSVLLAMPFGTASAKKWRSPCSLALANARVAQARAEMFPSISLTAFLGSEVRRSPTCFPAARPPPGRLRLHRLAVADLFRALGG